MAESYKKIGSISPLDNREYLLCVSPSATTTLVSNITVTNKSSSSASFDINVYKSGVTSQNNLNTSPILNTTYFAVKGTSSTQYGWLSTDTITWTQTTFPESGTQVAAIFGKGLFVFVMRGSSLVFTSTNGITWTGRGLPSTLTWTRGIFDNNIFVFVSTTQGVARSTNGITWTAGTLPLATSGSYSLTFGNGTFLTTGHNSSVAFTSTDGITWTTRTLPILSNQNWQGSAYGNGTFLVHAVLSGAAATSTDGITWTARTLPLSSMAAATFGNETFILAPTNLSNLYLSSTNGITWTQRTLPRTMNSNNITFKNNIFMITGAASGSFLTSANGLTWTQKTLPITSDPLDSVAYGFIPADPYSSPKINNLYKQNSINANETKILEPGIILEPSSSIVIKDNSGGNLIFSAYGVEIS